MSEFLGTLLIVLVLWFGGLLYSGRRHFHGSINVHLLYGDSVQYHQSVERLCKAGYNIPKGLASMERVDKILKAENPIRNR